MFWCHAKFHKYPQIPFYKIIVYSRLDILDFGSGYFGPDFAPATRYVELLFTHVYYHHTHLWLPPRLECAVGIATILALL